MMVARLPNPSSRKLQKLRKTLNYENKEAVGMVVDEDDLETDVCMVEIEEEKEEGNAHLPPASVLIAEKALSVIMGELV